MGQESFQHPVSLAALLRPFLGICEHLFQYKCARSGGAGSSGYAREGNPSQILGDINRVNKYMHEVIIGFGTFLKCLF